MARLELRVQADGWSDAATGSHRGWRRADRDTFWPSRTSEDDKKPSVRYLLFVIPYQACYPDVKLTATVSAPGIAAQSKTRRFNFGCAE